VWNAGFGYTVEIVQSDEPAGTVVSTDPSGGTQLDPNSRRVAIRQSSGPPEPVAPSPEVAVTPAPAPPPSPPSNTGESKTSNGKANDTGRSKS
jgi:eukaryotic-like serine/threonine-protein kinase